MFKRIYIFFITYMIAGSLSSTLLIFWLFQNNFKFSELVIYYLIMFFVSMISILYLPRNKISSKKAIFWGIVFNLSSIFVVIKIFHPIQLYLSAILGGLNIVYFWITYNIMYFKYSSENKRGLNSGIYFFITPLIGIIFQPLAGIIAQKFGFNIMFSVGLSMYLIPLFLTRYLPDFEYDLDVRKELKKFKFNWTIFFQGISSRVNYSIIGIFTLFFIKTPVSFGNFFGYLAIVAAFASLINGYISDKIRNRKYFFYLFTTLSVISFIPLAFVDNPYHWGLVAGIINLCFYLASPFALTFSLDYYKDVGSEKAMILREVFLNMGYFFCLLIVFLVYSITSSTKISLIIISLISCFLPVVSYLQGVYRGKINS